MYQISLPVGYKTARPQTGDWKWLWRHFRTPSLMKKQIALTFSYFLKNNARLYHFLANLLAYNKKMTEKSVFHEASSPEMMSQSFPVSCFWSRGFVPHQKWNLTLLVHQNTGKENHYRKIFLLHLSVHWGDLIEQIKKICHLHFKTLIFFFKKLRRSYLPDEWA